MRRYTRVDNIHSANHSIWVLAKMLNYSGEELDGTELKGLADAIMDISSKANSYCSDLQPDEFDDMKEIDKKISNINAVLSAALKVKESYSE